MQARPAVLAPEAATAQQRPRATPARVGVCGAVLLFLALALLSALATPPYRSSDEAPHAAYAVAVGHGTIPHRTQQVRSEIPGGPHQIIYTANHPPLYYALVTGPLLLGIHVGYPVLGLHLARIESALFSAGTVALTAVLAGMLTGRRETAVAAAAIMATLGAFVSISSFVFNDSLATLLSLAVLLATLVVLRNGPRPRSCALLVVGAAAAITTRASNVEILAVAAVGLLAAGFIHGGRIRAVGWVLGMVAACAAASGWFYALNQERYGHLTGRAHLFTEYRRPSVGAIASFVSSPRTWGDLAWQTYGDLNHLEHTLTWSNGLTSGGLIAIWSLTGVGVLWRLRRLRGSRRPGPATALVVLHCALGLAAVIWWLGVGGRAHIRYVFPLLPVVAVVIAAAVLGLAGGRFLAVLVVTVQLVLSLVYLAKAPAQWTHTGIWNAYPAALGRAGLPVPTLFTVVVLLLAAAGWLLCTRALLTRAEPT